MGVGGYFGVQALSNKSDSNADGHCVNNLCDATGLPLRHDAVSDATISTVVIGAGAVAVAAGAVLWFTAPTRRTATVGFDGHRLLLTGAF